MKEKKKQQIRQKDLKDLTKKIKKMQKNKKRNNNVSLSSYNHSTLNISSNNTKFSSRRKWNNKKGKACKG